VILTLFYFVVSVLFRTAPVVKSIYHCWRTQLEWL